MGINKEDLENKIKDLEKNIITLIIEYKQNNIVSFIDDNSIFCRRDFFTGYSEEKWEEIITLKDELDELIELKDELFGEDE